MGTTTVPCLGTSTVPCLGTFASALPGHVCSPCLGRLPVPCLGTLASVHALPGHACSPCLGRLPVPCLGTLASSLPGNVCQCPAWARCAVPAWDALPVPCLGTFANALPGHVCQSLPGTLASSLPGNAICWDAVPSWALFLCLSDKHERRASAPFQAWNATHPCALLLCFCNERQVKRMQSRGKKEQTASSEGSGWLCENERTRRKGEWREGWFAVVESRSKCAKVKAVDVMHAYLMPTWSKCECCWCGACVYAYA